MDFYFDLSLIQSQKIILTPQLRQAIEILKMNSQELSEYILREMETNPALEMNSPFSETQEETEELENDNYYDAGVRHDDSENRVSRVFLDTSAVGLSLKEHLLLQLHALSMSEIDIEIAEYLIDNVDDNGYLCINLSEVAAFFNIPIRKVEKNLNLLQTFDPPGICARNLKECLLIQLNQMEIQDRDILNIVMNHLDGLADNKLSAVAKETGLSIKRVAEVLEFIKTLEPRPGREFYGLDGVKYIIPDVTVKEINDRFEVLINEESTPPITISSYYKKVLKEDINIEAKKFIQSKIDSVAWLIKCIQQRKNTLIRVSEHIVNSQIEFFKKGKGYIKPLTMKEVAAMLDIHESTVSRTVSGKYLQCSWGVFDMKYFFPPRVLAASGKEITGNSIKKKIQGIIDSEDKKHPLSDSQIVDILKKEGLEISRRTVAKYRCDLKIPSSSKRKKY
ncbi:MAG TPA: RNA polymerase factor sigma-54 [Acetivibrio sp.]|nr:RNA polymerase factor sigma-54 [Acetivibrio sp.]